MNNASGERFVPNDAAFEPGEIVRIITVLNMSGKSTFLRQVALIVPMAQNWQLYSRFLCPHRIGRLDYTHRAQSEIHAGQSTLWWR